MEQEKEEQRNKKRKWLLLLLLLLSFVVITVLIVLYILGSEAAELPEQTTAPTIVITTPTTEPEPEPDLPLSISVKLETTTGKAYSGGIVEIHSDVKTAVTNSDGIAFIYDIEEGMHTIYAKSSSGSILASVEVEINASDGISQVEISGTYAEGYEIQIPTITAVLEIQLTIFGNYLKIDTTSASTLSFDNTFTNDEGVFYAEEYNVMTPQSNVVATSGEIIIPGVGVIQDDGTFVAFADDSDKTHYFEDGMSVDENGTIYLSTGKESYRDTAYGVYFADDEVSNLSSTVHLASPDDDDEESLPDPTSPTVSDGDNVVWSDGISIDIFSDFESIYPGASGEYAFTVENPNYYGLDCYLTITQTDREDGLVLPLSYVLSYQNTDGSYIEIVPTIVYEDADEGETDDADEGETDDADADETGDADEDEALTCYIFNISQYTNIGFILNWSWEFENGNDEYDTQIGSAEDLDYEITIMLYSEGV